ncbi:hypothetical protein GWK47_053504 [Chionoecetes opilio]|uniref:Uncharacterized protein n=1 Tax=Chionoecetes opilio TaxID=41210 RepID=A0A8J4Y0L5_CHIOP|nr:hypothetical protein GWK47_053504 [Chionoecetes opilio]
MLSKMKRRLTDGTVTIHLLKLLPIIFLPDGTRDSADRREDSQPSPSFLPRPDALLLSLLQHCMTPGQAHVCESGIPPASLSLQWTTPIRTNHTTAIASASAASFQHHWVKGEGWRGGDTVTYEVARARM